jgi:hypothetical protein
MVRFKMVGNDNPLAIAEVIEEGNIRSFRINPEWEEIIEVEKIVAPQPEAVVAEVKVRKPRTPKKETVE